MQKGCTLNKIQIVLKSFVVCVCVCVCVCVKVFAMSMEMLWSIEAPLVAGRKVTASKTGKALTPARTGASQSHSWHSVFQSAKDVLVSSFEILDIQMCAGWVSQSLTVQHKTKRKPISSKLLACFEANREIFIYHTVTSDENRIHQFEPETRGQAMQWHCPQSP